MILIPLSLVCALLAAAPADKQVVLAKMDKAAAEFKSMSGKISKVTHTAVINDNGVESGTIWLKRLGKGDIRLLVEIAGSDPKSYALQGKKAKAEVYYPKIQTVQEFNLGKQGELLEQFLLLGFGTPTRELLKAYSLSVVGEETVAGQKTARVVLIPNSEKVKQHLTKAELWISLADGHTVQQKFYEPSGDYRQATYSEVKWNLVTDSEIALKLPKGVKREQPLR